MKQKEATMKELKGFAILESTADISTNVNVTITANKVTNVNRKKNVSTITKTTTNFQKGMTLILLVMSTQIEILTSTPRQHRYSQKTGRRESRSSPVSRAAAAEEQSRGLDYLPDLS